MTMNRPVLKIERVPGDFPRAMEQLDGDLLVPAQARPLLERALLQAEEALDADDPARSLLLRACHMLGVERRAAAPATTGNLLKVRPI